MPAPICPAPDVACSTPVVICGVTPSSVTSRASMPTGVPADVAATFQKALVKAMDNPEMKAKFLELGAEPMHSTPDELHKFVLSETARYAKIVKEQDIRAD